MQPPLSLQPPSRQHQVRHGTVQRFAQSAAMGLLRTSFLRVGLLTRPTQMLGLHGLCQLSAMSMVHGCQSSSSKQQQRPSCLPAGSLIWTLPAKGQSALPQQLCIAFRSGPVPKEPHVMPALQLLQIWRTCLWRMSHKRQGQMTRKMWGLLGCRGMQGRSASPCGRVR